MSRPKKQINKELFESLCACFMTEKEICSILKVTPHTLIRFCRHEYGHTFKFTYNGLIANIKYEIRKMQWKTAMQGDPRMLIWLGKNYLGQTERNYINQQASENEPEYLSELQEITAYLSE